MSAVNQPWSWVQGLRRAFSQGRLRGSRPHDSALSVDPTSAACGDSDSNDDENIEEGLLIASGAPGAVSADGDDCYLFDGTVPTLFEICARTIVKDHRLVAQLYYNTPLRLEDLWHVVKYGINKQEEFMKDKCTLDITGNRDMAALVGNALSRKIDRCERLVSLVLDDCKGLSDNLLRNICIPNRKPALPHLQRLSVCGCTLVTDGSLEPIIKTYNVKLKYFQLSNCGATQRSIKMLARWCPNLEVVAFAYQLNIRDKHCIHMINKCPKLKQITAAYCRLLTDASVVAMGEKLSGLETLDVSYCDQIGASVESLQRCKLLQGLRLQNCPRITDGILKPVLESCTLLEVLCLRSCQYVTMDTVETIAEHCGSLRSLDVVGFRGNGNKALATLSKSAELRNSLKEFCSTQRVVLKMTPYLWQLFGCEID